MKFTLDWLFEHLNTSAKLPVLVDKLNELGLEVEHVDGADESLDRFTVASIVETQPHPNADRLRVCSVDTVDGRKTIVCGAPNARAGLKTAYAAIGVTIPFSGVILRASKIRGVDSEGMLCSARELGLGEDSDGILELPSESKVGAGLLSVVQKTITLTLGITPNRGDCLGIRGIARDLVAAGLGSLVPLPSYPATQDPAWRRSNASVRWEISKDHNACQFVCGAVIEGVDNQRPTPAWMKKRLQAAGIRSISLLVDISNYLTLDLGRPVHVFDADQLHGNVLKMRFANPDETFVALDQKTYHLTPNDTVVSDQQGVLGLAGIMGGLESGVQPHTKRVFLEVALFQAGMIRKTGQRLALTSDARFRFERGVDRASAVWGIDTLVGMIVRLAGGHVAGYSQDGHTPTAAPHVTLQSNTIVRLGGKALPVAQVETVLDALGFAPKLTIGNSHHEYSVHCTIPSWRFDITSEACLVEEILRCVGYDKITATSLPPVAPPPHPIGFEIIQRRSARLTLAQRGLTETVGWPFVSDHERTTFATINNSLPLRLSDPIDASYPQLTPSPLPNLLRSVALNARRGQDSVHLFEIAPGYHAQQQLWFAAGIRYGDIVFLGPHSSQRTADLFDVKADVEALFQTLGVTMQGMTLDQGVRNGGERYHPHRSGEWRRGKNVLATFGDLHPLVLEHYGLRAPVVAFELVLSGLTPPKRWQFGKPKAFQAFTPSQLPTVRRDFAFVVPQDFAGIRIVETIETLSLNDKNLTALPPLTMTDIRIFDDHALSPSTTPSVPNEKNVARAFFGCIG